MYAYNFYVNGGFLKAFYLWTKARSSTSLRFQVFSHPRISGEPRRVTCTRRLLCPLLVTPPFPVHSGRCTAGARTEKLGRDAGAQLGHWTAHPATIGWSVSTGVCDVSLPTYGLLLHLELTKPFGQKSSVRLGASHVSKGQGIFHKGSLRGFSWKDYLWHNFTFLHAFVHC
jgi:hypothetical protein